MKRLINEKELAESISLIEAVEAAYPEELEQAASALARGLTVLIECEKGLTGFFYVCLRNRLRRREYTCHYIDGRRQPEPGQMSQGIINTMINQLRDAVQGVVDEKSVLVLPHLDLLTTTSGGLTHEAREVIPLLYENPQILWLGFADHSFPLPRVIEHLFSYKISMIGIARERLPYLVTQREGRKLGKNGLDIYRLYKYVSGLHAVRLRRLLESLEGEDYPDNDEPIWDQIRYSTISQELTLPDLNLDKDIGGYQKVKKKIQTEILELLKYKDQTEAPDEIERLEQLIPKGMLFWGPPGTGKTFFAKAIAANLGATIQIISGPELKSRWVGESEQNLREIFIKARQSAPSLIVFDEIDAFAARRGTFTGSGVEHSMVNQLLTEMDGFRKNEMIFIIATTNFPESIDPALLRPGRFEFQLHIPYPEAKDREAILQIYDKVFELKLTATALEYAVKQTGYMLPNGEGYWAGDHLRGLCRALARKRLRLNKKDETTTEDIMQSMEDEIEAPVLTKEEEFVVATHECGHAVVALHCKHVPPIERISIRGDLPGSLGFIRYADPAHRYVITKNQLLDAICVLFGGREAEDGVLDDISTGATQDIAQATSIARTMVEQYGMGGTGTLHHYSREAPLSEGSLVTLDMELTEILDLQRERARTIIAKNRKELETLREQLLKEKVIDMKNDSKINLDKKE